MAAVTPQRSLMTTGAGLANIVGGINQFYQTCAKPEILETFRCATFVENVTTKARLQGLIKEGLEYTYTQMSDPVVHKGYDFNSEFASPDTPRGSQCRIRLGYFAYTNEKIEPMVLKRMTNGAESVYRADRSMRQGQVLAQTHQADFLCWLASQVHPCNEGTTAGKASGSINLGSLQNPLKINPRNILSVFTMLDQTLDEHNLPGGNRAAIFSAPIKSMLRMSIGGAIANTGRGVTEYMNSMCAGMPLPCGDSAYVTNCLPPVKNDAGQLVFPIYYLWRNAVDAAYGMVDEYSGIFRTDGVRAVYAVERQFIAYGFANIYCQGIARAWVTIDPDWTDKLPGGTCA